MVPRIASVCIDTAHAPPLRSILSVKHAKGSKNMGPPMSRAEATIDDLRRVPGKAELVNGGIVRMPPTGGLPGYAGAQILASLHEYGRRTGTGHGIPDNVGFIVNLPHRKSFSPDVAFYTGELTMDFARG